MKIIKILLLSILVLGMNLFAQSVATITALKGLATVERDGSSIKAAIGLNLEQKDVIKTQDNSKLQIIFKDDTIITLGKKSNFSIEEYLFEENQEPAARFGILKGAMRTITGKIGKIAPQKFTVETKTTTIGIRGTNFAIVVGEDGSYQAYCTYGTISATINGEIYIIKQGFYITISPSGKIEIKEFTPGDLKEMKERNYGIEIQEYASVTKDGFTAESSNADENNEQLDLTVNEESSIVVEAISETAAENATQQPFIGVEDYVMNNAYYTGTYINNTSTTPLPANGSATLAVDFGADTAILTLDPGGENATFDQNPQFSGSDFTLEQNGAPAATTYKAEGTFEAPTGNIVNGTFTYSDNPATAGNVDSGTYNVSSSQSLY